MCLRPLAVANFPAIQSTVSYELSCATDRRVSHDDLSAYIRQPVCYLFGGFWIFPWLYHHGHLQNKNGLSQSGILEISSADYNSPHLIDFKTNSNWIMQHQR